MAQPYPIVGIDTGVHPRLEIHDLQNNDIQFSLFIRALTKLKDMNGAQDRQKPNSWWQIGSIHGLPYTPWSGDPDGPQKDDPNSKWGGYCYHGSVLFPTWHRVLIMLVEQAVVNEAISIANEFEEKDCAAQDECWVESAKTLRFPFWDWTKVETAKEGIPKVCQLTEITIVNPGGSFSQVANPLNHYVYASPPGVSLPAKYMANWTRTYRWANKNDNPTKEMYGQAARAFSQEVDLHLFGRKIPIRPVTWLRQKIAGLFTYDLDVEDGYGPNMWAYFACTGAAEQNVGTPREGMMLSSIEEPHNTVHLDVGGNGSMSTNDYAGFDPIFFLHHTNVDRIYAFWEYIYPQYWIGNGWKNGQNGETVPFIFDTGNFWQDANATIDHSTPLCPFRNECLEYWTSDATRGLLPSRPVNKYYTYPPITDPRTCVKVQVDVPYDVNDLRLRQQFQQTLTNEWGQDFLAIAEMHRNLPILLPCLDILLREEGGLLCLRQFTIVGLLPEFAFTGSYRLELYLLPEIVRVQQGVSITERAGTHVVNDISVLGRTDPDGCAACRERRAAGSHIRGFMQLDPRIILYIVSSLDPIQLGSITGLDHVCALIKQSFGVRLVRPDGTKLATAEPDVDDEKPLEEYKLPKLTLHSHVVKFHPTDPTCPIDYCENQTHGAFGKDYGWKGC